MVVEVVEVLVVDVLVVVDVPGRGQGSVGVVVVVGAPVVVEVVEVVVEVVPAPQPLVAWLQVFVAADQVHLQVPLHGADGRGVVPVVVVGGDVVPLEASIDDWHWSPSRTIAQRSQVPGSRHRMRADPQATARRQSVAPCSMSAN